MVLAVSRCGSACASSDCVSTGRKNVQKGARALNSPRVLPPLCPVLRALPPSPSQALLHIAGAYAYDGHVTPDCITLPCPDQPPRSPAEMKSAEELFRVYDLYLWLYDRLGAPGVFRGRRQVLRMRQQVADLIDQALQRMGGLQPAG